MAIHGETVEVTFPVKRGTVDNTVSSSTAQMEGAQDALINMVAAHGKEDAVKFILGRGVPVNTRNWR